MSVLWPYLAIAVCLLHQPPTTESSQEGKAQCKRPTIENMDSLSIDKEYYNGGEEVTVWCKSGYHPSSGTMRCDNPPEWTPPTFTCTALCKNPDKTTLRMTPDKKFYNIGDTVTVNCPVGYRPSSSSVRCENRGTSNDWNPPPQCRAQCAHPAIRNMQRHPEYKEYYDKSDRITVRCKPGYYPSSHIMQCLSPRTPQEWNPPTVTCIAQCKRPTIENMDSLSIDKEYYNGGEEVTVWCKSGYHPSSGTMRCDNPPEWTPPTFTCTGVTMTDWRVTSTSISARISCTPDCPHTWIFLVHCCPEPYNYRRCTSKWSDGRNVTFTDLQPFSIYRISITLYTARNYYHVMSENIQTSESVPEKPDIVRVPSMEDNTIGWRLDGRSGRITGFQMNVSAWRDYNKSFAVDGSFQFPPNVTEYKIPLQYGTNYTITLRGFTSAGGGEVTTENIKTDIGDPLPPAMEKASDGTLQFHPVPDLNGPVSSYGIIVFRGVGGNLTKECVSFQNVPYNSSRTPSHYTAAVLPAKTLTGPKTFILGDNQHYNGFHNAPLTPGHNYSVYIRVTSRWKRVKKSSCTFAGFLQVAELAVSTQIIAGMISVAILLLVLLLLVILWRSHSRSKSRHSSDIPLTAQTGIEKRRDIPVNKLLEVVKDFRRVEMAACNEDEDTNVFPLGRYLEYKDLPSGFGNSSTVGQAEENQAKNRYKNILPYDDSRVVLRSGPSRSDYINASYIDGYKAPKLYIATQGPLPETLADFWSMVWQENSSVIVMLTGLQEKNKVKCERYWPEQSQTYGDITVSVHNIIQTGAITIRSFSLKKVTSTVQLTVEQLQYLRWPDHEVPHNTSDLVQLIELMNKCNTPGSGPVIVHCSAGIGRTGTFISLDILLKMARAEKKVNVYHCVSELRRKRVKMVQEKEQYIFLYDALLEALLCGNTIVPVTDIQKHVRHMSVRDRNTNMSGYDKEFQALEKVTELYQIYQCKEGKNPENLEKNRNPQILPGDQWRPVLMSVLSARRTPGYINAVFVNSNNKEDILIVTQLPMRQTLADFWALVWDYKCTGMVMMQGVKDLNENGCRFFPDKGDVAYGIYKVRMTASTSGNGYTGSTLSLRKTKETSESLEVKLWQLDSWPLDRPLPENPGALVSLIAEVEKHQQQVPESHILVTCCDGASRSGLFCAGMIICDQIRSNGCLDVSQAVRSLRRRRYQFIPNVEQYSFCHTLAQSYLDSFETYGNFK